uniref:Uncharacterized protein n=1 Tax=Parascaris univalens TaxID=6257 RepID=A0A915AQ73_PARUN
MRSTTLSAAALFVLLAYILAYGNGAETAQDNPEYHTEKMNLSLPAQINSVSLDLRALAEIMQKSLDSRGKCFSKSSIRISKPERLPAMLTAERK